MQVYEALEDVRLRGTVLTIGNFDGVHRGHQALVAAGRKLAEGRGGPVAVMTFEPHPAAILAPDRVPPTLTPLPEKLRWLEAAGADVVVVVPSRAEFFSQPAAAFITDVIVARFAPVGLVVGRNFRFGLHRQGDVTMLAQAGQGHGYEVQVVEPVRVNLGGHPETEISSSLVRHLLASGNVEQAALCLGRPYALLGRVAHGLARGRDLGFPTINLEVSGQLVPPDGVYAGRAEVPGTMPAAAISIGRTPTFQGQNRLIEAFLLDYRGDLYGQFVRLEFLEWLRPQQTFADAAALTSQIAEDVLRVRSAAQT